MSMFLGGRWLTGKSAARTINQHRAHSLGFGCSASGMAAKLYIAEIAPPRSRGAWMGVLNSFYYVGQILASGVAVSVSFLHYDRLLTKHRFPLVDGIPPTLGEGHSTSNVYPPESTSSLFCSSPSHHDGYLPKAKSNRLETSWLNSIPGLVIDILP
jgi:hypothetical protein